MNPKVSIIIPVYNGANYVAEAIDSALAQTYKNIEIIVVNDGSRDDGATEKVVLSYGDKIKYIAKENGGVSTALNRGIAEMTGEYFSWLSHDDAYTPEKIENQVALITEENKDNMFMCHTSFIDKDSRPLERWQREIEDGFYSGEHMLNIMFGGYSISGCALLIPKKVFDTLGNFREDIRYMQDMELWYRFLSGGVGIVHTNKDGVLSRVHSQQVTVTGAAMGTKDAPVVGLSVIGRFRPLFFEGQSILKKYYFLCLRNRSYETAKAAKTMLKEDKLLSFGDKLKAARIKLYGKIRPTLVKLYYKLFFKVKR